MHPINSSLPEYSDKFDIVLTQLMKAKNEMGSAVKKDSANPFHKSKYASLGAHLELSESILFKHGLLLMHSPNIIDGNAVLIATLHHPESGQWTKSYLQLPNPKNDSQGLGSSITYMRRYSINAMLGLNAEDDDGEKSTKRNIDNNANEKTLEKPIEKSAEKSVEKVTSIKNNEKISKQEVIRLENLETALPGDLKVRFKAWLLKDYKTDRFENIKTADFTTILGSYERAIKAAVKKDEEVKHA